MGEGQKSPSTMALLSQAILVIIILPNIKNILFISC